MCTVGRNSVALKDMEKSGSFKVIKWHVAGKDQREIVYLRTTYIQIYSIYILPTCICPVYAVCAYVHTVYSVTCSKDHLSTKTTCPS